MHYLNLGHTGLRVSRLCLGMMSYGKHESRPCALDEREAEPILRAAMEGGINFYGPADVYNGGESEVLTGRLLRRLYGMREEYVVATKVNGKTMPGENGQGLSRSAGDDGRSPRCRGGRQGPVHRRLADAVAAERDVPTARVALAWLLHRPGVTAPIIGATKLAHLKDALAAEQLSLSPAAIERLQEPYMAHPVAGHS